MRLYQLRLRAIGPFPGEHQIDFERLGASGLFLLEGPTGSGKSTIIDAVTFALYGKVAGSQASDDRMYSDFADPSAEPFVELDFETGSGLYRVRRSPTYQRPKRRGLGTTTEHAKATLWRLASPDSQLTNEPVATSLTEVGDAIVAAIGLSREQFVKTVVLPQGEFAAFLRAPAEERRPLLQKLFGTELYESVVRQLELTRRRAKDQRDEATAGIKTSLAAFSGALGMQEDEAARLQAMLDDPDAVRSAIGEHVASAAEAVSQKKTDRETADRVAAQATAALEQARQHETRRLRKEQLLAEREGLVADAAEHAQRSAALDLAKRAERVRPMLVAVDRAEGHRALKNDATQRARELLPAGLRTGASDSWPAAERERRDVVAGLKPLLEVERGLADREEQLKTQRRDLDFDHGRLGELLRSLIQLPEQISNLREQEQQAVVLAAGLPSAEQSLQLAEQRLNAAIGVEQLKQDVKQAERAAKAAEKAARAAQAEVGRRWQRYLDGIAGVLGSELVEGEACPVCGSDDHPRPALPEDGAVTLDDVRRSEGERDLAVEALENANVDAADLRRDLATVEQRTEGLTAAQAREKLGQAQDALKESKGAADRVPALQNDVKDAEQSLTDQQQAVAALEDKTARAETRIDDADRELQRDRGRVDQARGDDPDVRHRVERFEREAAALTEASAAAGALATADRQLGERREEARQAAEDHRFESVPAAAAAWLEPAELSVLDHLVTDHDERVRKVDHELGVPELAAVDVAEIRGLGPLELASDEATKRRDQAQADLARAEDRHGRCSERAGKVRDSLEVSAEVVRRTAPVIRMADLASANTPDNARRMTLPTFVLLELFGEVVAQANQRLMIMSDGRYSLEHVQDKDGARKSGLGLEVRDHQTEKSRKTGTLSGGETFYCSLALALGLADVVTAEAGGIDLGTLFVDEGFGTLDSETLDNVMEVLSRLRAGGRAVGIVSHVAELKDRISERVEVRRNPDGSSRLDVHA